MSQSVEGAKQIEITDVTPANIIAGVRELLHEAAKVVFDRNIVKLSKWIQNRIEIINESHKDKIDSVVLKLNAYNETAGLGIQSVSIGFRNGTRELRPVAEFKDATIGVVAPGLLEDKNAPSIIASFGVEAGTAEVIYPSEGLRFDESHHDGQNRLPQHGSPVVYVKGPNSARTVVQKAELGADDLVVDGSNGLNSGVYACEYVKFEK